MDHAARLLVPPIIDFFAGARGKLLQSPLHHAGTEHSGLPGCGKRVASEQSCVHRKTGSHCPGRCAVIEIIEPEAGKILASLRKRCCNDRRKRLRIDTGEGSGFSQKYLRGFFRIFDCGERFTPVDRMKRFTLDLGYEIQTDVPRLVRLKPDWESQTVLFVCRCTGTVVNRDVEAAFNSCRS